MSDLRPKILDLTYLAEAADGDVAFISEILGDYLVEMDLLLFDLDSLIDSAEFKTVVRSAHTIKGASANVGATRVRETAATLEAQANQGSVEGGDSLVNVLRHEVARVKELVEREGIENLLRATG